RTSHQRRNQSIASPNHSRLPSHTGRPPQGPSLPHPPPGRLFFFSSRRRHTRSVSAFLLNRSSDLLSYSGVKSPTECQQSLFESHFASRQSLSDCPVAF